MHGHHPLPGWGGGRRKEGKVERKEGMFTFLTHTPRCETSPLNVFLAWVNLDFGIESCLYHGMDTYQNTWLQFLFPLYIWVLIGIVILSSRYSSWMTRKLGSNPVAHVYKKYIPKLRSYTLPLVS